MYPPVVEQSTLSPDSVESEHQQKDARTDSEASQ